MTLAVEPQMSLPGLAREGAPALIPEAYKLTAKVDGIRCHQRQIRESEQGRPPFPCRLPDDAANQALMPWATHARVPAARLRNGMRFGPIPWEIAKAFIGRYEWLAVNGGAFPPAGTAFGMWEPGPERDMLFGVEIFINVPMALGKILGPIGLVDGDPHATTKYLARGACAMDAGPHAATMLLGASLRALRLMGVPLVVAYADIRAGEAGIVYRAANAIYGGLTLNAWRYYQVGGAFITANSLYRKLGLRPSQLPPGTPIRVDRQRKLRFFWVLNEKKARPHIPPAWLTAGKPPTVEEVERMMAEEP